MSTSLRGRSLISIEDLTRTELEEILSLAGRLKMRPQPSLLHSRLVASCFFEPSTRTRLSFEAAVHRLGGRVIGFADGGNTSLVAKGESFSDTMRVVANYADAIVLRHPQAGSASAAAHVAGGVPIFNAGDGAHQHPTQTLLDLFTIQETQGRLVQLNIALVGDLKYGRTVHSLAQALGQFAGNHLFLVAPENLGMPNPILHSLAHSGISYSIHAHINEVIGQLDVLYMTRPQRERFAAGEDLGSFAGCSLRRDQLIGVRKHLKILHPLPRLDEIEPSIDETPYAHYFQQAANGVYARAALMALSIGETGG